MSNENDKPIFGNEMKSTASEQTGEHPERVFTPKEVADRVSDHLSVNDRLDVLEFRHKSMVNPPEPDWRLYSGAQRENNDQTVREILTKHDTACHAILDELGIPKTRAECTSEELERIDNPNKKLRNASLSGSYLGMLEELTVTQRCELGVRFYGQYMLFTTQPNRSDEVAYRFWVGDVSAACDNMHVPRYLKECTDEEHAFLAVKMSDREMDAAYPNGWWATRTVPRADLSGTMERFRELMSKHPLKVTVPSIGPRDHLNDMDPWPLRDYQSDPAKMPLLADYIFDVGRKHFEEGPQAFQRLKDRVASGAFKRGELIIDAAFMRPSVERKTLFTEYAFMDWQNRSRCYPAINFSDSIDMFRAKMADRPFSGRTPGYYAVHQAYAALPDINGVVRVLPRDTYTIDSVMLYGRQTGKRRWQQTMLWAKHTDWGTNQWPRSPQMGFFLHAAYPLLEREMLQWRNYPSHYYSDLAELARADLFPHIPKLDYDNPNRSRSAPRYPNRCK